MILIIIKEEEEEEVLVVVEVAEDKRIWNKVPQVVFAISCVVPSSMVIYKVAVG